MRNGALSLKPSVPLGRVPWFSFLRLSFPPTGLDAHQRDRQVVVRVAK